ncbi:beta-lactamase family protein [Rhodobacteraceae bacterium D3-12]|nr:beta-lactamase family protein [Rhodobacteraceae bacterium D3-12]
MSRFSPVFDAFQAMIGAGEIPGARIAIHHAGTDHIWSDGVRTPATGATLGSDTLFRLASLTKIVSSVVALRFVERGALEIDTPVHHYLPGLAGMQGATTGPGADGPKRADPVRPMTVRDLFRHTSGLTYGQFSDAPVQLAYQDVGMADHDQTRDDLLAKLETLPLTADPGTQFGYGMSTDVLGWLLEEITGEDLEAICRRELFDLVGMRDAAFRPADVSRIAEPMPDPVTGEIPVLGSRNFYEAGWLSAGHGLFASGPDMDRFAALLRGHGSLDGHRILRPDTFAEMTRNQLPEGVRFAPDVALLGSMAPTPERGQGFGLGVLVRLEPGTPNYPASVGEFGWNGLSGTCLWIDPEHDLSVCLLMQSPVNRDTIRQRLKFMVHSVLAA